MTLKEKSEELDCPYEFTSRCTMGRCDCKPKQYLEEQDVENKIIHFAEWLTGKHTTELITLYEHFNNKYYENKL